MKKRMQNLNWATAHLNLSTGSLYSHCIVTPRLENWPRVVVVGGGGGGGGGGGLCHDTSFVS